MSVWFRMYVCHERMRQHHGDTEMMYGSCASVNLISWPLLLDPAFGSVPFPSLIEYNIPAIMA